MLTELIPISVILLNEDRTEGGKGDIESLARNMDKYGQINAVTVVRIENVESDKMYRIIAGRRRIAAAELLGWTEIRADVYEADEISEDSEEMIALSENAAREEMNAIDEGILYANELKKGTPVEELAALFCRNKSTVYQRAKLARLIPEMRELYKAGRIPLHVAAMASDLPEEAQKKLAEKGEKNIYSISSWEVKSAILNATNDSLHYLGDCAECAACTRRTRYSDKTLFPELAESDDRCLDHECFCKTLQQRIETLFTEFSEKMKGDPHVEAWDGSRIVATVTLPDGIEVLGIKISDIADDEDDITEPQDDEEARIKEQLEAAAKVEWVPCWNGTEFVFIELAKREDVDALYYENGDGKKSDGEPEWEKARKERLSDIFSSLSEEKRSEIIADARVYSLEDDVRQLFIKKLGSSFQPENCNTIDLLALVAQLSLSNKNMRKFFPNEGIAKEESVTSLSVFEKLRKNPAKNICIALIQANLAAYGPHPAIYGIDGSDWVKIYSNFEIDLKALRDESVKEAIEEQSEKKKTESEDAD